MTQRSRSPVVHLELHTGDLSGARAFYASLCGWRSERIECPAGTYHALELGGGVGGGIVECATRRPVWLPYVEVADVHGATERARELGATLLLEPREGPSGWRSAVALPAGGEIALWQPKLRRRAGQAPGGAGSVSSTRLTASSTGTSPPSSSSGLSGGS